MLKSEHIEKIRYYYLDAMRSVLMYLIIFYHAANIYSVDSSWIVTDPDKSFFFNIINEIMPFFRVSGFFVISGFFTLFSLEKYSVKQFLKVRLIRAGVPLISTGFIINSIQAYVLYAHVNNQGNCYSFLREQLLQNFLNGSWVSHVWFLINLIIYFLFAAIIYTMFKKNKKLIKTFNNKFSFEIYFRSYYLFFLALFPLAYYGLGKIYSPILYGDILNVVRMYSLWKYVPYFLFGIWLYKDQENQREFSKICWWHFFVLIIGIAVIRHTSPDGSFYEKVIHAYSTSLLSWITIAWCFKLFFCFFNKRSKLFIYLSDASYSIYLFHQVIVVMLGYILISSDISIYLKFIVIVIFTTAITVGIHHFLILRFNVLRIMFNGKALKTTQRSS